MLSFLSLADMADESNVSSFIVGSLVGMALGVDDCLRHSDKELLQFNSFCIPTCPIKAAAVVALGAATTLLLNYVAWTFDPDKETETSPPRISSNSTTVEGAWEIEEELQ